MVIVTVRIDDCDRKIGNTFDRFVQLAQAKSRIDEQRTILAEQQIHTGIRRAVLKVVSCIVQFYNLGNLPRFRDKRIDRIDDQRDDQTGENNFQDNAFFLRPFHEFSSGFHDDAICLMGRTHPNMPKRKS